jgi:hypothetical protein
MGQTDGRAKAGPYPQSYPVLIVKAHNLAPTLTIIGQAPPDNTYLSEHVPAEAQ